MRLQIIKTIYIFTIVLIIGRLSYWQIIKSDDLTARAEEQRSLTKEIQAARGEILFSDGSVLATIQPTFVLYVQPKVIDLQKGPSIEEIQRYKKTLAQTLSPIFYEYDHKNDLENSIQDASPSATPEEKALKKELEIKADEQLITDALNKDLYWVGLNRKVTDEQKRQLQGLNLVGLGFDQQYSRYYPEGSSSAHLLGFVGSDIYGNPKGYFGVEGYYDGELKGKNGQLVQEKDAQGVPILIGKYNSKLAVDGKTLMLSIDRNVQSIVEESLKKGMEKYGAKSGSVIVMDPKTGNILAMAAYPNYDPTHILDFPKESFKNPIVADGYEPGSTFKVLVMAAALNEKVLTPETICDICDGPVQIGGYDIRTWDNKYFPKSTMTDVIVHSDNTGMVFTSHKLGLDKLYDYIKNFGFGSLTNVDLQDEASPDLRDKKDWKEIDAATASFGQGISVTPLQVVTAVSSIANGGKLMEPHVVTAIKDEKGISTIDPKIVRQVISPTAADQVKQMMVKAVDEGEAKFARIKGYQVAGKTGTAQIPVAGHYDPTKTIASFVGFAPVDDPKFVMLVRYDQPASSIYGAETAAPTFFDIAKSLFTYYNVIPTEEK